MKIKLIFLFLVCSIGVSSAQIKREPSFWTVIVPDSIATLLDKVANLLDTKKKSLIDGIYTFKGQGPHFPRRLFIYHGKKLYIFKSKGAFNPIGVIQEYATYLSHNNLSPEDAIRYLKAICKHLDDEYGETYGGLIK